MKERIVKSMFAASIAGISSLVYGAAEVPSVSNVQMSQAQDRTVTITYKLANAPAIVTLDIQTNATDGSWVSIGGENISGVLSGVPKGDVWKVVDGDDGDTHTITWRPDRSAWVENRVAANGARAVVTAWATNAAPDYMVFDLAATSSQRVSYYPGEAFLPGGLLTNPDYRTTRLVMRKIPANGAVFTMGSVAEAGRDSSLETFHRARLGNDYYMGVFEVTQTQWMSVMGMGSNPSKFTLQGSMRPVECVSYQMARTAVGSEAYTNMVPAAPVSGSFMDKLRVLSGNTIDFDLPSEAEWEYACRAGNGEGYWGNGDAIGANSVPGRNLSNVEDPTIKMDGETPPDGTGTISPENATAIAGSYGKNGFGLFDMHGNVQEWCIDMYKVDITALDGAPVLNAAQSDGSRRYIMRGGHWSDPYYHNRSASRRSMIHNKELAMYGIRVKCTTGAK